MSTAPRNQVLIEISELTSLTFASLDTVFENVCFYQKLTIYFSQFQDLVLVVRVVNNADGGECAHSLGYRLHAGGS